MLVEAFTQLFHDMLHEVQFRDPATLLSVDCKLTKPDPWLAWILSDHFHTFYILVRGHFRDL